MHQRIECRLHWLYMRREELDAADVLVDLRDVRLTLDDRAVVHDGVEAHMLL